MELEEYKFDHFKNIDEVMYYFNYWYKEEDVYSINRYLSLKDFNYISNKYQELQKENQKLKRLLEEKNKPQIFIDTQDMEERYSEGLYQDYLEEENKKYKEVIDTIKKEVDKIFVEGQIINKCLLLSIYENIWRILKEVSE